MEVVPASFRSYSSSERHKGQALTLTQKHTQSLTPTCFSHPQNSQNMAETRKPDKLYATHPKGYGKGSRPCRVTGRLGGNGLIRKYGLNMKRQVFRERAIAMGWEKYN
jgi:small subunit ribosomal protein S29e